MNTTIAEIICDTLEHPSRYESIDYDDVLEIEKDRDASDIKLPHFVDIDILKDILECILGKGIEVYDVTILRDDVDMGDITQDVYMHFIDTNELKRFTGILALYAKEISLYVIRDTAGCIHYYISLLDVILDVDNRDHAHSLNVNISNLTYEQAKMLEIFFMRIADDGKIGHTEHCTMLCDGDGDFRPKIDITKSFGDSIDIRDSLVCYGYGDRRFAGNKYYGGEFYLHPASFSVDYLPLYLMDIYNRTKKLES